jgi:diguanylate cyclase (GGDEF)-like protein
MSEYSKLTTILYVEDEDLIREGYERMLRRLSKELWSARDGQEGVELYKKYNPDIVISDIKMPVKNGIDMAKEIKEINPAQVIIFTTAHTESAYTLDAIDLQVDGYLLKPVDKKKLKTKLNFLAKNIILAKEHAEYQKTLQAIIDYQSSIIFISDFKVIKFASMQFFKLLGVNSKEEFSKSYENILNLFVHCDGYIYADSIDEFLQKYDNASDSNKIVSIATVEGEKAFYIGIKRIDENDNFVVTLTDVTTLQREKKTAEHNATHDKLTQIFNRFKFDELFKIEYQRSIRYKRPLSIAILDIDHFKKINDTYGHLTGDKILQKLARKVRSSIRKTDIFARWGGEEFVILLDETKGEQALRMCEHLRELAKEPDSHELPNITISIGLSELRFDESKESFLKRADEALYEAKNGGRDKVVLKL